MQPRRVYYRQGPKDCPLEKYHVQNTPKRDDYFIRHWHTQMEVYLMVKGSLRMYSLVKETDIHNGDIYLIPPEEVHGIYALTDGAEYWSVVFSPELVTVPETHFFHEQFLKPLREGKLRFPRVIHPTDEAYQAVLKQLQIIFNADKNAPDYKSTVFLGAIGLCLAIMPLCHVAEDDEINTLAGVRGNDAVHICQAFIGMNYGEKITLQQLADLVHMHPNYLCKLFKDYMGQTVFEYLTSIRISFATQFIRNSPHPLREIAEQCGFNSMSYFNKKFKEHTGITPYAYSKLYKNR